MHGGNQPENAHGHHYNRHRGAATSDQHDDTADKRHQPNHRRDRQVHLAAMQQAVETRHHSGCRGGKTQGEDRHARSPHTAHARHRPANGPQQVHDPSGPDQPSRDDIGNPPKPWRPQLGGSCSVDLPCCLLRIGAGRCRPEPVSRLAAGHPEGLALTPARTVPSFGAGSGQQHAGHAAAVWSSCSASARRSRS